MNVPEWGEYRNKARRDLFYLATEVLGYALVPEVHKPVCSFFLQPDPDRGLYDQDGTRSRLLLDPRGHFKTTIDIAHCIQLILNFPDIRILIVSGVLELAQRMLNEIKYHFTANDRLRNLFPEIAVKSSNAGLKSEFTSPTRLNGRLREPTVSVSTIDSVKAGSHFDWIKFDDVVNEVNSQNKDQIQACIDGFMHFSPILEPGGFKDVIGTRYDYSDLYGWIIDNNNDNEWAVMQRAACSLPMMKNSKILFPRDARGQERFSYKILNDIRQRDPYLFNCQYLNDPTPTDDTHFPMQLIKDAFKPSIQILPLFYNTDLMGRKTYRAGSVFCTWDLAFSEEKQADFTCGVAGLYDRLGRLFIVDLVLGRFSPYDLVKEVVGMALRWRPFLNRIAIEKNSGAPLLELGLTPEFNRLNFYPYVEWVPTNPKRTKQERILGLNPLLKQNRLFFSSDLPHKDDLIKQFTRFPNFSHDDIPDAIEDLTAYHTIEEPIVNQKSTEEELFLSTQSTKESYFDRLGGLIG